MCSVRRVGATPLNGNLGNPGVAPPQSMPYGKSYSEWSLEWWLYAMPLPLSINPFGYGTDGTLGQSGKVWFLGGTFTGANLVREVTVPAGTALFFPVMNAECSTLEPDPFYGYDEASLRACANGWTDRQVAGEFGPLFCKVDGVELKNIEQYRCQTTLIDIIIPATPAGDNNLFWVPVAEPTPVKSVGDGVYVFLYPLAVGTHTLEFPGIQYTIHVTPEAQPSAGNPGVAPTQSMPYGKSYSQWVAEWWKWTIPKSLDQNPFAFGTDGAAGQSGPVWFIGGSFVEATVVRQLTVPAGKALFFPIINAECSTVEPPPFYGGNEAELTACAKVFVDMGAGMGCELDGVALQNLEQYRCVSPMFPFAAPDNNVMFVPGPVAGYSVGDGYYLMLRPLAVGEHVLHFTGSFPDFNFTLDVTYQITVASPKKPVGSLANRMVD